MAHAIYKVLKCIAEFEESSGKEAKFIYLPAYIAQELDADLIYHKSTTIKSINGARIIFTSNSTNDIIVTDKKIS